jgi:small subunit ribosomal protein S17
MAKQILTGTVISDKMDKTIVVEVERAFAHPQFHKVMRKCKKYKVHDEQEIAKTGDEVEFGEGRPLSKTKYMYLRRIIRSS